MNVEQVKNLIAAHGWTPQEKKRRKGTSYLYAAKRDHATPTNKIKWRYIAPFAKLEEMTEEEILLKLK